MRLLTASFILSVILMTQANDITDDLNLPPLSESLFLFDVISDSSLEEIKWALNGTDVRHSFKVIGENRYFFVANTNSTAVLYVTFPTNSKVTQYPVEHKSDYFKMFGITHGMEENDTLQALHDENLTVFELDIHIPLNTPTCVFKQRMADSANMLFNVHSVVKPVSYAVIGRFPPKLFDFCNRERNQAQNVILDAMDTVGGPGNIAVTPSMLVKI